MKKSEEEMMKAFIQWGKSAPAKDVVALFEETDFLDFQGERFNMPISLGLDYTPVRYFEEHMLTSTRKLETANDYSYAMAA